jgi:hypothetical protein
LINKTVNEEKERIIQEAAKNFETAIRKAIGDIAIMISNYYSIETISNELMVTINLEKK